MSRKRPPSETTYPHYFIEKFIKPLFTNFMVLLVSLNEKHLVNFYVSEEVKLN